jgi:hypothetical protein
MKAHISSCASRSTPYLRIPTPPAPLHRRAISCSVRRRRDADPSSVAELNRVPISTNMNARWLSETKARVGKCVMFGLSREQARQAAQVCRALGTEWRGLVAGREGFLVDPKRAGLLRQGVVWGEMDCMVCLFSISLLPSLYLFSSHRTFALSLSLFVNIEHPSLI